MNNPDELAGLPEDVREAINDLREEQKLSAFGPWDSINIDTVIGCTERLARENAELRDQLTTEKFSSTVAIGSWKDSYERVESELAALKRRIAEAPKAGVHDDANLGPSLVAYMDATDLGKTFALLPVGGE